MCLQSKKELERGKKVGLKVCSYSASFFTINKKVELKYKSPLVNNVPWYDRLYRGGGYPNHAVLIHFEVYI